MTKVTAWEIWVKIQRLTQKQRKAVVAFIDTLLNKRNRGKNNASTKE